ncbi:probable N-acetyltransferase 14 isoform X1 [Diorhabda carinulata]|uniref:probable N-acetyltransferase 14 isoform X1 n=1 Tax=Diorhabda carinulata TaxID=1163345 RepID=UPI0025A1D9E5|nr:probable N-acetyltransferase 14 isoform X1 [Diorhabda carinulata]
MSYYIVIRKKRDTDFPSLSEVVRNGYLSTVNNVWKNAIFQELTFESMILISAILFICFGVPLHLTIISVPIVLLTLYISVYLSIFMKVAQFLYEIPTLDCWVAEVYEPYFSMKNPENCWYKMIDESEIDNIRIDGLKRKIIGTVAVTKHKQKEDWTWLFRLVVDKRYRRKGIGIKLVNEVQNWARENQFNNIELVISECQEGCRDLFNNAGFEIKQLYHKKIFAGLVTLQMFQLQCEVRSTF